MHSHGSKIAPLTQEICQLALYPHSSPINPPPGFPVDPVVLHCQSQSC